ncbi:MAG: acyl-CoA dehydrogenase [Chloroflexi bacterium]|nr:MAG: acyl-CoA dehydrogenase [Chloroflexota bacterium]
MTLEFSLSDEQKAIQALAHDFAEREIRPVAAEFDESEEFPYEVVTKAHRLGLSPAAFLPEEYGGQGFDFLTELILNEELSWGCAGIAVCIQSMALAMAGIRASGTDEQKRRWLPEFTNPDRLVLGGLGLTEPDSGSDALAMKTRATRVSDGYVLNGTKQFCTNGGIADYHVIYANTDPSKGPAGIASFLVEKDTPGLRMGRKEKKLGVRASHTAQVILEDCHVPLDHRLGGEPGADGAGPGALGALATLEATRPGVAAGALGIARAAYEFALEYAQDRKQFGKPLWQHEAVGFKLADMAMKIDAARLLIWRAGWMATRGDAFERAEGSMAKCFAADVAMEVTTDAIQVLGGYGYIKEYPVEKWFRDAKIYQIWEGTAEIQRLVISRAIAGQRAAIKLRG